MKEHTLYEFLKHTVNKVQLIDSTISNASITLFYWFLYNRCIWRLSSSPRDGSQLFDSVFLPILTAFLGRSQGRRSLRYYHYQYQRRQCILLNDWMRYRSIPLFLMKKTIIIPVKNISVSPWKMIQVFISLLITKHLYQTRFIPSRSAVYTRKSALLLLLLSVKFDQVNLQNHNWLIVTMTSTQKVTIAAIVLVHVQSMTVKRPLTSERVNSAFWRLAKQYARLKL